MIFLCLIVVVSVAGVAVALFLPGWFDLLLLAAPSAVAAIGLLLHRAISWVRTRRARIWIVVDGSNVLYWQDETPRMTPLHALVDSLKARGFSPRILFDANAGYLVSDRYRGDADFARMLGLPPNQVRVVPKGTPADPHILSVARDLGARIVTNDRYRDWITDHPEIGNPGHLIRGGYRDGTLWLDLPSD